MPNPIISAASGFVSDALSGPLAGVLDAANSIIGRFIVSPEQKLAATTEVMRAEQNFRLEMLKADGALAEQQSKVIIAEATSESWMARNWRPILMLTFTFIIAWNYVIAPMSGAHAVPIPENMWDLLKLGITGYIVGRSAEKIAPAVVAGIQAKHNDGPPR